MTNLNRFFLKGMFLGLFLANAILLSAQVDNDGVPYIPGEWIVKLEKGKPIQALLADLEAQFSSEVQVARTLSRKSRIFLLQEVQPSSEKVWKARLDFIRSHGTIEAAQFNHTVTERATLPDDPGVDSQWHHVETGDHDIDSDAAWDFTTGGATLNGDNIVVCVIEGGGSNFNHPDLIENHWTNPGEIPGNGIDDDDNGYLDDYNGWNTTPENDNIPPGGHGTSVSGMIGAKGNNGIGGSGVNWDVEIMQVVIGPLNEANVIEAYNYPYVMRDLYNTTSGSKGAFVVATNASWGIDFADPTNYPVWCAYYDDLGQVGILNCGATANNNEDIDAVGDMPTGCSSDYMVSVTATNNLDLRTFSGYGQTTIDLAAPGESVYLPTGSVGYGNNSGTSFASPCVAGAIALMYSVPCAELASLSISNPQLSADLVRQCLFDGVDLIPELSTETVTGGRLNVGNSVTLVLTSCGPLPECNFNAFTATAQCAYNSTLEVVEGGADLSVLLSENFCKVDSICYGVPGETPTYVDLNILGINFGNLNPSYMLTGLASNTTYEIFAITADDVSAVVTITTPNCEAEIPGCTDSGALNFETEATFDDGSCQFPCSTIIFSLSTDCWGGETSWQLLDESGIVIQETPPGTLLDVTNYVWSYCLPNGCYTLQVMDEFADGIAGSIYPGCNVDGTFALDYAAGPGIFTMTDAFFGALDSYDFCVEYGVIPGCTDPVACNYELPATIDDGSCILVGDSCNDQNPITILDQILPDCNCIGLIGGCIDMSACNFTLGAQVDDGSCVYPGCADPIADNFDPEAGCSDGSCFYTCVSYTLTINTDCWGEEVAWDIMNEAGYILYGSSFDTYGDEATINSSVCLSLGCYTFNIYDSFGDGLNGTASGCEVDGSFEMTDEFGNPIFEMLTPNGAYGFSETQDFCVPVTEALGCLDALACNFNSAAWVDDGSCTYEGCTDQEACNYDAQAGCDDGTCEYVSCAVPCPGDLDGDGTRQVGDLLALLATYGCSSDCGPTDLDGDGGVGSGDLLEFLAVFGVPCP